MSHRDASGLEKAQDPYNSHSLPKWDIEVDLRKLDIIERFLTFLKWIFGIAIVVTLLLLIGGFFLGGWSEKTGFKVSDQVLMALIGTILGETAGLIAVGLASLKISKI